MSRMTDLSFPCSPSPNDNERNACEDGLFERQSPFSLGDLVQLDVHSSEELVEFALLKKSNAHASIAAGQPQIPDPALGFAAPALLVFDNQRALRLDAVIVIGGGRLLKVVPHGLERRQKPIRDHRAG